MTLYTTDFNGETIEENATLDRAPHKSVSAWKYARFSDCWIKLHDLKHVELNAEGNAIVDGVECYIRHPGTHPGRGVWLDPVDDVMVPDELEIEIIGIVKGKLNVKLAYNEYHLSLTENEDGDLVLTHNDGFCSQTSDLYCDAAKYFGNEWDYSQVDKPINDYLKPKRKK